MANRVVSVELKALVGGYVAGMSKAAIATAGVGESADLSGKKAKAGFDLAGKASMLMGGAVAGALVGIMVKSTEFEKSMSAVGAATQATAATLGDLREAAMKAGADTQYSATEAANGITEMAKAGVSAKDIMGGGLTGALSLAAAGQLDVADAAGIASVAMQQFSLSGEDLPHVADLLAAGAGKAMGSVDDLGMALNQAGLVANAAGLSIEETTGGLAAFANAGLIGSDAGTSFKSMLQALQGPSSKSSELMAELGLNMYDSQGHMLGLSEMAGQLQSHLGGMTDEQRNATMATIFGSDAVRAANVLYKEGASGITEWTKKVDDSGFAAEQAAALNDNLAGDLERLGGSFDTLLITLGSGTQGPLREFVQMLGGLTDGIGAAAGALGNVPGPVVAATVSLAALAALRGPLGTMFTSLATGITSSVTGIGMATGATTTLGIAAGTARIAVAGLVSAAAPLAAAIGAAYAVKQIVDFAHAGGVAKSQVDALNEAIDKAEGNGARFEAAKDGLEDLRKKAADAKEILDGFEDQSWFDKNVWENPFGDHSDLVDAKKAYEEYTAAIDAASEASDRASQSIDVLSKHYNISREDVIAFADAHGIDLSGSLQIAQGDFMRLAGASVASGDAMINGKTQAEDFQTGLEGVATAASDSRKQIDLYKTSLDVLTGAHITAAQAESDFYAAIDASKGALDNLTGSVLNTSGGLDLQSEAGRKTQDVLFGVRDSADQYIATLIEQGATSGEANAKDAELRQSFYDTALAMTGSKAAAEELTNRIYGIPAERETTITADTKQATDAAAAVQAAIDAIKGRTITVSVATMNLGNNTYQQSYDTANGGRVLGAKYQATGGPVIGPGGPTEDKAGLYALSNGEHVWTAAETRAVGGHGAMEELRREALANGRGRAAGGPIGIGMGLDAPYTSDQITQVADALLHKAVASLVPTAGSGSGMSGTWTSIAGIVQRAIPQARINSTYRPGDPGYHGRNKAVDFGFGSGPGGAGSAGLASIARFLYSGYGRSLAEIIYDGIGDNTPDVKNGADHTYNAATRAEHRNHVHAAVYHQGTDYVPQTGFAYLEKGEAVIPASANVRSREFSGSSYARGSSTTAAVAPQVTVQFFVDGEEFRGMTRTEINGRLEDLYRQKVRS